MLCPNPTQRLSINELRENNLIRRITRRYELLHAMSSMTEIPKSSQINNFTKDIETKTFSIEVPQIPSQKSL
ncbi:unnamed protein product [Paramecium sonneborni]|uniref:Uncharacterized protein n=1 Tax=Paramecium sonneborni TaxID=65129 RepID=A0A8S1PQU4_9CILI|nr:unnamed protein product [Paramecium sonneborni]